MIFIKKRELNERDLEQVQGGYCAQWYFDLQEAKEILTLAQKSGDTKAIAKYRKRVDEKQKLYDNYQAKEKANAERNSKLPPRMGNIG